MTEIQRDAIAKADASMAPALRMYEQRSYLWRLTCRLPLRELERLNDLLGKLTDEQLREVARYAEGLAEFG